MTQTRIQTAIVGASGYSGIELVRLLLHHPQVELAHVIGSSTVGQRLDDVYPMFRKQTALVIEPYQLDVLKTLDVVFLALPHGEALKRVPELIDAGVRVIDLSGDFRLKSAAIYEEWYHQPHSAPAYLANAVYGLTELFRADIPGCQLLSNPGCYPTGASLLLAPILSQAQVNTDALAITALSGVSGAGRKANVDLIFAEVNESVKAYRVGNHQHTPEIRATLERVAGRALTLTFVPHLLPITRGIYTTVCLTLREPLERDALLAHYQTFYQEAAFVRVLADRAPEIKFVTGTNYCDIGVAVDVTKKFVILTSTIDNLIKGAAGQAVQNMNLMFGFPEVEGLV